jgi:hypothetical protein
MGEVMDASVAVQKRTGPEVRQIADRFERKATRELVAVCYRNAAHGCDKVAAMLDLLVAEQGD